MDELYNLKHEDGCRYWTHGDFCTCGAAELAELKEAKAALSDANRKCEALEMELAKHQESSFHPDWSMLQATRECLKEYRDLLAESQRKLGVAREALNMIDGMYDDNSSSNVNAMAMYDSACMARSALAQLSEKEEGDGGVREGTNRTTSGAIGQP